MARVFRFGEKELPANLDQSAIMAMRMRSLGRLAAVWVVGGLMCFGMVGCPKPGAPAKSKSSPGSAKSLDPAPPAPEAGSPLYPGAVLNDVVLGGKSVPEAVVLSVSDSSVSFRCGRSILNVAFADLPPEIVARARQQLAAAPNYRPVPSQPKKAVKKDAPAAPTTRPPTVVDGGPAAAGPAAPNFEAIRRFAYHEAVVCLEGENFAARGESVSPRHAVIDEVSPVSGWDNEFCARGHVRVAVYNATQGRTRSFEIRIRCDPVSGRLERRDFTLATGFSR